MLNINIQDVITQLLLVLSICPLSPVAGLTPGTRDW